MRFLKSNKLRSIINSYIVDSPQPSNISYMWNFGSLLATCLGIQIVTGVILAMHYTPNVDLAFISVEHIMRDVNYGWMIRYLHANTASFFFIFVYLHIGRGMYYGSYKSPRILPWSIGVIILVLMMGTAFLGYLYYSLKWLEITNNTSLIMSSIFLPFTPSLKLQIILAKNKMSPVGRWENLDLPGSKKRVQTAVKDIGGIYAIINLVTGDMYIGSAVTGRIGNRFHKHLYGGTGSIITYAAVLKYGLSNFAFVVLEFTEEHPNDRMNNNLLMREDYYLSTLKPIYNIAPKAGNTLGVKHSNETKAKMKINYSSERREAIRALNRGKSLSSVTVEKMRQSALNRSLMSQETRDKISLKIGKFYLINRVDNTDFLSPEDLMVQSLELHTIKNVRNFLNCDEKTVSRALKKDGIIKKIWQIKVKD